MKQLGITISTDEEYKKVLEKLEQALKSAEDCPEDPLNPLIDALSRAVERYERQDEELAAFVEEALR